MIPCSRCQTANPDEAKFCFKCGAALAPAIPVSTVRRNRGPWLIAAIALVALLTALGVGLSGILRSVGRAAPSGITAQRAEAPPPSLLEVEAEPKAGITRREQIGMPPETRAWLEHLERVEKQRRDLSLKQIGSFMATMTTLQVAGIQDALKDVMGGDASELDNTAKQSSADNVHKEVEAARDDWRQLRELFESKPPPSECIPLKAQYEVALRETSGMMMDLMDALDRAMSSNDPEEMKKVVSELYGMKGKSAPIDEAGGATDTLLGDLCRKYETRKWFSIARDIGGGGMLGL